MRRGLRPLRCYFFAGALAAENWRIIATSPFTCAGGSLKAGMSADSPFDGPPSVITAARKSSVRFEVGAAAVKSVGLVV